MVSSHHAAAQISVGGEMESYEDCLREATECDRLAELAHTTHAQSSHPLLFDRYQERCGPLPVFNESQLDGERKARCAWRDHTLKKFPEVNVHAEPTLSPHPEKATQRRRSKRVVG